MGQASHVGLCAASLSANYEGVKERPPGSNRSPKIDEWNQEAGVPVGSKWCMSFARAMFKACGVTLGGHASVGTFLAWADQHAYEVVRPFRGDLVCYFWDADDWPDHVEIVLRVLALRWPGGRRPLLIRTRGGNTGDAVRAQVRRVDPRWRFCRIPA
jgi:hypothetical protein